MIGGEDPGDRGRLDYGAAGEDRLHAVEGARQLVGEAME